MLKRQHSIANIKSWHEDFRPAVLISSSQAATESLSINRQSNSTSIRVDLLSQQRSNSALLAHVLLTRILGDTSGRDRSGLYICSFLSLEVKWLTRSTTKKARLKPRPPSSLHLLHHDVEILQRVRGRNPQFGHRFQGKDHTIFPSLHQG